MTNIKSVFFDADNTIINHKECEKLALIYLFENINISFKEEYQDIFRPLDRKLWDNASKNNPTISKEKIPTYRFKKFFELININYSDYNRANLLFQEGLSSSVALIDNAEEIIKYLYNKKYNIFIITNGLARLQKPRIMNSCIYEFINDIIVSEEIGKSKPDPEIFNVLMERNNITPNESIMVGDSLQKDILGAKNSHIQSIWYNPQKLNNDTNIIPEYEINNLLEIKNLL